MGRLIQNTISIWYKPPFQYSVFVFQVVDSNHYFSMVYGFISDHHFSTALCIFFIPYSSVFSGLGLDSSADHDISLTKCQRAIQAWNVRLIQAMGKVSASKKAQDPAIHCFWRGVIHQTEKVANKLWGKNKWMALRERAPIDFATKVYLKSFSTWMRNRRALIPENKIHIIHRVAMGVWENDCLAATMLGETISFKYMMTTIWTYIICHCTRKA